MTRDETRALALAGLRAAGAEGSRRKWWAFEGFTEIDCCLETDRIVLVIEGKRNERLALSTEWYEGRNQLHRNLEVARDLAAGGGDFPQRQFGVLVAAENPVDAMDLGDEIRGLPHLTTAERSELMGHYFGSVTWREICEATALDFGRLPDQIARIRQS